MRKKIIGSCLIGGALALSLSLSPTAALAQSKTAPSPSIDPKAFVGDAKYCLRGAGMVTVSLNHGGDAAIPGTDHVVSGSIRNRLDVPLFDASVIVQIYKVSQTAGSGYATADDVVGRFVALKGLSVKAGSSAPFQFAWHVPHGLASNVYKVETFVVVGDKMPVAGSEGIVSPAASDFVHVAGDTKEVSYLDWASMRVDGAALGPARTATTTSSATVSVDVLNTYAHPRDVVFEYRVYRSGNINDGDLDYSASKIVSLQPGKKQTVAFSIKSADVGVRTVVMELKDGEKSSLAIFRAINPKAPVAEGIFAGLSSFPFVKGEPVKVFGCALVSDTSMSVNLSFVDDSGKKLLDLGSVTGNKGGLSLSKDLTPASDMSASVNLAMSIIDSTGKIRSVLQVNYACDNGQCTKASPLDVRGITIAAVILLAGALVLKAYWLKKRPFNT